MNDNDKLDRFFEVARQAKPDTTRVEFGFETRLLARLRAERAVETPWFAWAWRLAPVFAAVVLALGVWNYVSPEPADFHTALAGEGEESLLVSYLTGD